MINKKKKINWGILAKYLDQEMNDQELKQMDELIQSDSDYSGILSQIQKPWEKIKKQHHMIEVNTDSAWKKLKSKIEQSKTDTAEQMNAGITSRRKIVPLFLQIAAVIILVTGLSYIIYMAVVQTGKDFQKLTLKSKQDETLQSTLPDGSIVYLKAHSRIDFEYQKTGTRKVFLKGEAYFNVTHDPEKSFIIITDQAFVEVLGTSFFIQANQNNNQVKVFVEAGRVLLSDRSDGQRSLIIEPGYMGMITKHEIQKEEYQNPNWISWKTGKLVFRETRFEDVINDLNHTFGTTIIFRNPKMAGCRFTGTFYNQPVDTLLQVLTTAFNLDIEHTRSKIILIGEGCE